MVMSDENSNPLLQIRPKNEQEGKEIMGGRKFGAEMRSNNSSSRRRALSVIDHNFQAVNKRGLPQSNGICDKNAAALVTATSRPITRKYAAQMAVSQHPRAEESKRPKTSANEITSWEDIPLTDAAAEDDKDRPVPMSLEQTEFGMSEKYHQMEVEMEDIFEEAIVDIDGCDKKNPLAVVDYVDDLYAYYKKMESCSCVSPGYMTQQVDINERMRAILIDWLIEVHHKFDLRKETLFLTVNLIDRFLAKQTVVRKQLQLMGLVAMLLACKYEEVSVPVVDDLVFISDKAYTRTEVLEMERLMLNTLQFNMSVPTAYVFMKRFLKAAQSDSKLELLSFFLIELCLVEYEMLKHPPSFLAAAAVYTAQSTIYGVGQWTKTCEWHTGYSKDQLIECSKQIVGFHERASTGKLTGVHRKYNTAKFGYAARCEPAYFLLVQTPLR